MIRLIFQIFPALLLVLACSTVTAGECKILVVVGMQDEYDIAVGDDVMVVSGTAHSDILKRRLDEINPNNIRAVFSFGVAGSLDPSLKTGDLLVSESVLAHYPEESGKTIDIQWPADPQMLTQASLLAARENISLRKGIFYGTNTEARDQQENYVQNLHRNTGALLIDNESHAAAQFASQHGLKFLSIRAISDSVYQPLPPAALLPLDPEDGSPDGWAITKSLLTNPMQIPALIRTAIGYQNALDILRTFRTRIGFEKLAPNKPAHCS